jgi:hypothetical protein
MGLGRSKEILVNKSNLEDIKNLSEKAVAKILLVRGLKVEREIPVNGNKERSIDFRVINPNIPNHAGKLVEVTRVPRTFLNNLPSHSRKQDQIRGMKKKRKRMGGFMQRRNRENSKSFG